MSLGLAHFSPDPRPVALEARVGGQTVYRRSLAAGEGVTLRLSAGGAPRAFVFSVSGSFVPRRLGLSGDRRELGLLSTESP
jgi:hypothetical protein